MPLKRYFNSRTKNLSVLFNIDKRPQVNHVTRTRKRLDLLHIKTELEKSILSTFLFLIFRPYINEFFFSMEIFKLILLEIFGFYERHFLGSRLYRYLFLIARNTIDISKILLFSFWQICDT